MVNSKRIKGNRLETVLITGGCGFIGVNLVKYLAERGYKVKILDNLSIGREENLLKLRNQGYRFLPGDLIIGDIRNREVVGQAVEGMAAVVHLAAHTNVTDSLENPEVNWDINTKGTFNVMEACRKNGVEKFIFASSNAAVGEQTPPIDELKVPKPLSPYGASKLAGEALCNCYYHSFGLKTVSLRFANCYGTYSNHKTSVVSRFVRWASEEKPIIIYGSGNQTRDFIHVDDVCRAIHLSIVAEDLASGEIFQVATGTETTISKLAEMVGKVTEKNLKVIYKPARKAEITRNYSDISKAREILCFQQSIDLEEGLSRLWHDYVPT